MTEAQWEWTLVKISLDALLSHRLTLSNLPYTEIAIQLLCNPKKKG